jgi:hypothetical protein
MRSKGWVSRYALTLCFKRAKTYNDELNAPFLQKLMKNLHIKNLFEKVHVSSACAASLSWLKRDSVPTASAMTIMNKLWLWVVMDVLGSYYRHFRTVRLL